MKEGTTIQIRKPDDWHLHLRYGDILAAVAPLSARQFGRALVMPNLLPPVATVKKAEQYRQHIMEAVNRDSGFEPLMTCYLTDDINPEELRSGFRNGVFKAAKLYPVGATTNSQLGVTAIRKINRVLKMMGGSGIPLCIHGETVVWKGKKVDPYDREKVFIEKELIPLRSRFPNLKIVFEHVTTREGVAYVKENGSERLAATVTAHHLWASRIDVFEGGISAHYHCLPVIKREEDRQALRKAVTSGNPHFFLGTDSAPHLISSKRRYRAPGGIFTAHAALELYTQVFEEENALEKLEAFASLNGARFYGVPINATYLSLRKEKWTVDQPVLLPYSNEFIYPFLYEEKKVNRQPIHWRLQTD